MDYRMLLLTIPYSTHWYHTQEPLIKYELESSRLILYCLAIITLSKLYIINL